MSTIERDTIDMAREIDPVTALLLDKKSSQGPDAYLHDDGFWTAAKTYAGRQLNDRLLFAGSSKIGVYTAPPAAQPAPVQEPVAWTVKGSVADWSKDFSKYQTKHYTRPVYTIPPAQPAVPLTDEQIDVLRESKSKRRGAGWSFDFKGFARAIEAAHGITAAPEKGQP